MRSATSAGEGAQGEQVLDGVGQEAVAADGQAREGGQGWADGVQAAAVGQAGVGLGVGLIQPAAGHRDGAGRERPQLRLGPEPGADAFLGAAAAEHERLLVAIDQQLLHIVVGQVPFQRSQPQQRVEHRLAKAPAGLVVQGDAAGQDVFAVGIGQLLGDHRPHQRLIVFRRGEQPSRAQPPGQLGRGRAPHLGDQPVVGQGLPVGVDGGHVAGAQRKQAAVAGALDPTPPSAMPRGRLRGRLRVARPPVGWSWAATAR